MGLAPPLPAVLRADIERPFELFQPNTYYSLPRSLWSTTAPRGTPGGIQSLGIALQSGIIFCKSLKIATKIWSFSNRHARATKTIKDRLCELRIF